MEILVLSEHGYEESALGFSLSYNSTPERAKELFPVFAFKQGGENKFLESIQIWVSVKAPRFWWQEADTYRIGNSKQSESTMHTICKGKIANSNFEYPIEVGTLEDLNDYIKWHNNPPKGEENETKKYYFLAIKNLLPEGFLQTRIWNMNYKCLQNIYNQRKNHRLPQWHTFLHDMLHQIEHPEFIVPDNGQVVELADAVVSKATPKG